MALKGILRNIKKVNPDLQSGGQLAITFNSDFTGNDNGLSNSLFLPVSFGQLSFNFAYAVVFDPLSVISTLRSFTPKSMNYSLWSWVSGALIPEQIGPWIIWIPDTGFMHVVGCNSTLPGGTNTTTPNQYSSGVIPLIALENSKIYIIKCADAGTTGNPVLQLPSGTGNFVVTNYDVAPYVSTNIGFKS